MKKRQMSESIIVALLLACGSGFLDAYSYAIRGGAFALMQTGNMILFGYNIINQNISKALMYLIPISSFFVGVFLTSLIRHFLHKQTLIHWRQIILIVEIACFMGVAFIPVGENWLANMILSFAAGMQLQAFNKLNGAPLVSTMFTGNLRGIADSFAKLITLHEKKFAFKMLEYIGLIFCFIGGVMISTFLGIHFSAYAILYVLVIYTPCFGIMFSKPLLENNVQA